MITISLDKLLAQKGKKEQLAKGASSGTVTQIGTADNVLVPMTAPKPRKPRAKVVTTNDVDAKVEKVYKESKVTGILTDGVQNLKSTEALQPRKTRSTGVQVLVAQTGPKLDSTIDKTADREKKIAEQNDRSKYSISRESPKKVFEHYLSGLNNVPDYNRANLLSSIEAIVGAAEFRAMMAARNSSGQII
jgi:hypothetical protein